jgi:hypothetical protein
MSDYKIQIGTELDTKGIDTGINKYHQKKTIEFKSKLDTSGIDNKLASYKAKKPIKVDAKLNTAGLAKKIGEYRPKTPIKLNAELDTKNIDAAIRSYKAKKSIEVNVKLNHSAISEQIRNYKAKTSIKLNTRLDNNEISNQIKNYQAKTPIKLGVKLTTKDIDDKIRAYKAKTPIKLDVKINKGVINEQIKSFTPKNTIKLKAALQKGVIAEEIRKFKPSTPIKVDLELDYSDIETKAKTFANNPIELPVKLKPATKGFSDRIAKTPVSIEATLKNPKDISDAIKAYVKNPVLVPVKLTPATTGFSDKITKTPVKINATLNPEDINATINRFTPTSKVNVDIKLNPKDINVQVQKLQKPTEAINVGVKLDESTINADIALFKPTATLGIQPDLILENVDDQIRAYVPKAKIKVDVQVNDRNINSGGSEGQDIQTVRIARGVDDVTRAYRELLSIQNRMGSKQQAVAKLDTTKNKQEILELSNQIDELARKYQRIHQLFSGQFSNAQVDALNRNFEITAEKLSVIKQKALDAKDSLDRVGTSGDVSATNETDEVAQAYRDLMGVLNELNSKRLQLNRLDASSPQSSEKIQRLRLQIEQLDNEYNNLLHSFNAQGIQFTADQWNQLETVMARVGRRIDVVQAGMSDKSAIQSQTKAYKELLSISKEIGSLEINIEKLRLQGGNSNQIEVLENQLMALQSAYRQLVTTMDTPLTNDQWSAIYTQIAQTSEKLARLQAEYADARVELARDINIRLNEGEFSNDISNITSRFDNLKNKSVDTQTAMNELKLALQRVEDAARKGDDGIDELIKANQDYERVLKAVKNQLDINARAEKDAAAGQKLDDSRKAFASNIDAWLTKNSAAAKKFGSQMLDLKAQAKSCDQVTLNHLQNEFKRLDKEAEAAGLKMQTFGDRIKAQIQRYSSYFSVASVFMYASQAMRSMFEQIKLIDSAMTELKKVTNETDDSYNKFLSNAASKAKELGTTVDGLVASTADFARLGYGFKDAQGLAEVANIYAVVGDEIEGVEDATQSLISTLAAFKDEINGMDNSEFAMNIVDKMNEVSNNYAISSGGIGQALQRSASSMAAANNSLDETIALITAANEVAQNPEKVGNAMKTKFLYNCLNVQKCA